MTLGQKVAHLMCYWLLLWGVALIRLIVKGLNDRRPRHRAKLI